MHRISFWVWVVSSGHSARFPSSEEWVVSCSSINNNINRWSETEKRDLFTGIWDSIYDVGVTYKKGKDEAQRSWANLIEHKKILFHTSAVQIVSFITLSQRQGTASKLSVLSFRVYVRTYTKYSRLNCEENEQITWGCLLSTLTCRFQWKIIGSTKLSDLQCGRESLPYVMMYDEYTAGRKR